MSKRQYAKKELVQIAKRDNNTKRPYLLVNPLQGKHVPVSPTEAMQLFHVLSKKLYETYPNEKLLIIGFAETATAIGAAIAAASPFDTYYIHTTREPLPGMEYLFFTESHSHATEQKLIENRLAEFIQKTDRIIFAEDEVTTGNTILHIVRLIQSKYAALSPAFGIVSILNGMTDSALESFQKQGILCTYMERLSGMDDAKLLSGYTFPALLRHRYTEDSIRSFVPPFDKDAVKELKGCQNARIGVDIRDYLCACQAMAEEILHSPELAQTDHQDILVLGTEEFMFPALYFAYLLEKQGRARLVQFHATTRSPILPSADMDYPLFSRYELPSFYDEKRTTYLYNLKRYHKTIIIHDSPSPSQAGLLHLLAALKENGCEDIVIYRWSDK